MLLHGSPLSLSFCVSLSFFALSFPALSLINAGLYPSSRWHGVDIPTSQPALLKLLTFFCASSIVFLPQLHFDKTSQVALPLLVTEACHKPNGSTQLIGFG